MSLSIETILADARKLVVRLKEHDTTADCLIARTQSLQKQLDAMKQFQDYLNDLNDAARHRPRIGLIITLAQENSKIRELQQENKELRESLDEHQSALELIMSKYREQVDKLMKANSVERSLMQQSLDQSQDLEVKSQKISEMAAIMSRAAKIDGHSAENNRQLIRDLEFENHLMRQLLQIDSDESTGSKGSTVEVQCPIVGPSLNIDTQTDDCTMDNPSSPANDDDPFCLAVCSTLVRNPRQSTCAVSDVKSLSSDTSRSQGVLQDLSSLTTDDSYEHDAKPLSKSSSGCLAADQEPSVDAETFPKDIGDENLSKGPKDAVVECFENPCADSSWHQDNCNCCNNNEITEVRNDRLNENTENRLALHDGPLDDVSQFVSYNSQSNATRPDCPDVTAENATIDNLRSALESTDNSAVEDTSVVAD